MIEVKFTGESIPSIIGQMLAFMGEVAPHAAVPEMAPEAKPRRGRPPRASIAETEAVEAPPVEAVGEEEPDEVEQAEASPPDTIANEKVKQEVIAQLSDLFTAGKVKTLRHILDTYGNGAKSFPEIDASQFPAIKEALSRGEAA